jgi:hypothetical protein
MKVLGQDQLAGRRVLGRIALHIVRGLRLATEVRLYEYSCRNNAARNQRGRSRRFYAHRRSPITLLVKGIMPAAGTSSRSMEWISELMRPGVAPIALTFSVLPDLKQT